MQDFHPQEIYVDAAVQHLPVTKRILAQYPQLPVTVITDKKEIKFPQEHGRAKRQLYLAEYKGDPLKACQGMGDYVCCHYYTIALVSDCHLECTYCILQDYLKNNPVITVYTNIDAILDHLRRHAAAEPGRLFRIGTGELSDSMALDHITGYSIDLVHFARSLPNVLIELKTKTANVDNLIPLDHGRRTVLSWSINPQSYIDQEEHKCDPLEARLKAARRVADAGYPVGFHLDPLLHYEDWREQYAALLDQVAGLFRPEELAWISMGSLRFTKELRKISQERFPRSQLMAGELYPSPDGKVRYFRPLREVMYGTVRDMIRTKLATVPHYLCMETKAVWRRLNDAEPPSNRELEKHLTQRFSVLPGDFSV